MSLNHLTDDTPINQWLNIGANSIRCNTFECDEWSGDLIPSENLTWDLGSHDKNWRLLYAGRVKDLSAPVEAQDAINYVSAQILTTLNSGVQSQNANISFPILTIAPTLQVDTIGGYGTAGLLGLGSLPAINGSVYEYSYTGLWSGISGIQLVTGSIAIWIGSTAVIIGPTFTENHISGSGPFNVSGTIQFVSGVGTGLTSVNNTMEISVCTGSSYSVGKVNASAVCDTSDNVNFRCIMSSTNTGGAGVFNRTTGYVRNIYQPSAFP